MSKFNFILDDMRYSYSSVNTYETCPKCFYLTYILAEERDSNFFGDFGNLSHKTLQEYFEGNLEIEELPEYYENNYGKFVISPCPPYPTGMEQNYYNSGLNFFQNFKFDKSLYEIIMIEEPINSEFRGAKLIVKPDLVLREKESGDYILVDYKTSKIKTTKKDKKEQQESYMRQFNLYVYFLWTERNIEIKKIYIWYIRNDVRQEIAVNPVEVFENLEWFENTINKIKNEEEWPNTTSPDAKYFCEQICSMRNVQGSCRTK